MITGTALWYASRATGVVSLVLFSVVAILGIMVNRQGRLPGLPRFAVTGLHRSLSLLTVAFPRHPHHHGDRRRIRPHPMAFHHRALHVRVRTLLERPR